MEKIFKDFYRVYFKRRGTREDPFMIQNKKHAEDIIESNKGYSDKVRAKYGVIECILVYIFAFVILAIFFANYLKLYSWFGKIGIIGTFLFVFSIGIPPGIGIFLFSMIYDTIVNIVSIKNGKDKTLKKIVSIAIIAFLVTAVLYTIILAVTIRYIHII